MTIRRDENGVADHESHSHDRQHVEDHPRLEDPGRTLSKVGRLALPGNRWKTDSHRISEPDPKGRPARTLEYRMGEPDDVIDPNAGPKSGERLVLDGDAQCCVSQDVRRSTPDDGIPCQAGVIAPFHPKELQLYEVARREPSTRPVRVPELRAL